MPSQRCFDLLKRFLEFFDAKIQERNFVLLSLLGLHVPHSPILLILLGCFQATLEPLYLFLLRRGYLLQLSDLSFEIYRTLGGLMSLGLSFGLRSHMGIMTNLRAVGQTWEPSGKLFLFSTLRASLNAYWFMIKYYDE